MNIICGYHHPQAGFAYRCYLDQELLADWFMIASLDLMSLDTIDCEHGRVSASECSPVATYDASLDRMFNREVGYGRAVEWKP